MDDSNSKAKGDGRSISLPARLGQLKTLKDGSVTATLSGTANELQKILKLITACQAGNSLLISVQIVKPKPVKPVKKDAKEKSDSQKQKGPRRVRRYPYR